MRDRLITYIMQAKSPVISLATAESLADHLLEKSVIVPPCKVGDNAYYVYDACFEDATEGMVISEGAVVSMSLQSDGLWIYCRYHGGLTYWHKAEDIGKTVFLTREEAEKALAERSENEK